MIINFMIIIVTMIFAMNTWQTPYLTHVTWVSWVSEGSRYWVLWIINLVLLGQHINLVLLGQHIDHDFCYTH